MKKNKKKPTKKKVIKTKPIKKKSTKKKAIKTKPIKNKKRKNIIINIFIFFISLIFPLEEVQTTFFLNYKIFSFQD